MALFNLSGSKGSSSATTTTNTTATQEGLSTTNAASQQVSKQTSFDEASKLLLDSLTQQLSGKVNEGVQGYSKADAINDVSGVVSNIFKQFKETTLPNILGVQGAAGAYNSTSAQLLADNAYGQAVAQSSDTVLKAIADYAGIETSKQNAFMSSLLGALQLQGEATKTATAADTGTSSTQSNIKETSTSTSTEKKKASSISGGISGGFKLPF